MIPSVNSFSSATLTYPPHLLQRHLLNFSPTNFLHIKSLLSTSLLRTLSIGASTGRRATLPTLPLLSFKLQLLLLIVVTIVITPPFLLECIAVHTTHAQQHLGRYSPGRDHSNRCDVDSQCPFPQRRHLHQMSL